MINLNNWVGKKLSEFFHFLKMHDNLIIFILNYQYNHSEEYQIKGFLLEKI